MQKISDLAKNIQQKTNEQAQNTEKIVKAEFLKLEQSLKKNLSESENLINNCIHQTTQEIQQNIRKGMKYKTLAPLILGFLGALIASLAIVIFMQAKTLKEQRAELQHIEQSKEQTPVQTRALAKLEIGQNPNGTIWIQPRNDKKAKIGTATNGKKAIILQ